MAANRYNQPAQAEFINYYAPLPFNELLEVGGVMAGRADKARNDLAEYMDKYSKFRSPSQVDTNRYYDMTVGRVKPVVDQLVANPDLIKTAEGRSMLAGAINNVDYRGISALEQSRDALLKRQGLEQQLSAKGQYNPYWHGMDYAAYDTARTGIFNDLNLIPYQSIKEGSDQYFNALKDSLIPEKSNGAWLYKGVTEKTLRETAQNNINAYANSQIGQAHMREAIGRGLTTPDKAVDWLREQMVKANRKYIREYKEINPLFLENLRIGARAALKAAGEKQGPEYSRTQELAKSSEYRNQQVKSMNIGRAMDHIMNKPMAMTEAGNKGMTNFLRSRIFGNTNTVKDSVLQRFSDAQTPAQAKSVIDTMVNSNMITPAEGEAVWRYYQTDRERLTGGEALKILNDVDIEKAKVPFSETDARQYYDIDLESKTGANKNFNVRSDKNGFEGTFGRVPDNTLVGAAIVNENGKALTDIVGSGLELKQGFGDLLSGNMTDKTKVKILQDNAEKMLSSGKGGLLEYVTSNLPDIYMQPSGQMISVVGNNNKVDHFAYADVLIPEKQFKAKVETYLKDNNINVSYNDIKKLLSGELSGGRSKALDVINNAKFSRYSNTSSESEKVDKSETVIKLHVAANVLNNFAGNRRLDDMYAKEQFTGSNAAKMMPYSQDYNYGLIDESDLGYEY